MTWTLFRKNLLLLFLLSIFNCVTIQVPPITVTGTKTASEKQIIGEQRELEKDVWMISSAKTTSKVDLVISAEESKTGDTKDVNTAVLQGFAIIDAFASEFSDLKKDGVVGENKDGLVSNLLKESSVVIPESVRDKYNPEKEGNSFNILVETVKQINLARKYLIQGYIMEQKTINKDFNPDPAELLKLQKDQYHGSLQKGEYFQNEDGSWSQKP